MTCTKMLVILYFFLIQIVYGLPKLDNKEHNQCDTSGKQIISEFLTAHYVLNSSSTPVSNNFLGTVRINSIEIFAVLPLEYHESPADLLLRSPLLISLFQSCLYTCKEHHPSCHSLLYDRNSKECKMFKEVALENIDVENFNFVGREEEVVIFEQEDLLYAQKICLSRSDKWCENPSWKSTTNEYMMFQHDSHYITNWIDQILSKICIEQCPSNALCSLMIENDGDKCFARESKLVSYNCNISRHKIETGKNNWLFSRLDEPVNFKNSNNNQPPLCKRWDCISPFSPIGGRGELWWLGGLPSIILCLLILFGVVIVIRYWYISKKGESTQIINRQEDISNINRSTAPLYYVSADYTIRNVLQIPSDIQTVRPNLIRNEDPPSYEVACCSDYAHNKEEPPPGYHSLVPDENN